MDKDIYTNFLWKRDNTRPEIRSVIYDGNGFAYATDTKRALRWKEEKEKNAKLDVASIFKGDWVNSTIFNKSDYYKWLKNLPLVDEKIYCDICGGEGEVEWEFEVWTKMFECPKCDGNKFHKSGEQVPDDKSYFNLNGFNIDQKTASLLIGLMNRDNIETIKLNYKSDSKFLLKSDFKDCSMLFAVPMTS